MDILVNLIVAYCTWYVLQYAISLGQAGVFRVKWVNYRAGLLMCLSDSFMKLSFYLARVANGILQRYIAHNNNTRKP